MVMVTGWSGSGPKADVPHPAMRIRRSAKSQHARLIMIPSPSFDRIFTRSSPRSTRENHPFERLIWKNHPVGVMTGVQQETMLKMAKPQWSAPFSKGRQNHHIAALSASGIRAAENEPNPTINDTNSNITKPDNSKHRHRERNGGTGPVRPEFTANYIMSSEDGCFRFRFFCSLCGFSRASGRIAAASAGEAFQIAANEARKHFNRCCRCKKWVCDRHYNEDEMACVNCEPKDGQL